MRARTGMVLFEVIVAMTIFVIAVLSTVLWLRQLTDSMTHAHQSVDEIHAASEYLDIIALWPREDLDRHLGSRRAGPWTVQVDRSVNTIYTVMIRDSLDRHTLVQTALYRPEVSHEIP